MANTTATWFSRLCLCATALALCVIMLGAYTRLTHAGLGCPDWPGCYGKMVVPKVHAPGSSYMSVPIESSKAWTEMSHRYIAGTLGLLVLALCVCTYTQSSLARFRFHTSFMVLLVIFQALLGMWTVTLKLHPTVVMAHLMGGMTLCALLWWLYLRTLDIPPGLLKPSLKQSHGWGAALAIGLILVIVQILLGGWTSANYAALACTDFPHCQGKLWPEMFWREAFSLMPPLDEHYEGGWLEHPARITIHMVHRLGASIVLLYVGVLSGFVLRYLPALRHYALFTILVLIAQFSLGLSNVLLFLPLSIAVLHNGGACLLLLAVLSLNVVYYRMRAHHGS